MSSASPETTPRSRAAYGDFGTVFSMLRPQMEELDSFLRTQIAAFEPEIRDMADYCVDTTGKRIRPALVFLSGWREPNSISPELTRVAAVVEMVHLATLVHDDIMDEAELRRGRRTAVRAYGPVAAVLLGDALFSHALHLAAQFPTTEVCLAVADSTRKVCAGEIVQTLRRGTTNITATDYWRVIELKTAELFRLSCFLGSRLGGYPSAYVDAASRFGRHLGIAYQIYDDLADYFGEEKRIGKTLGTDLVSGKLTLPLLMLAERLSPAERAALFDEIQGGRPPDLALHLKQMAEHGVFSAVEAAIHREIETASGALAPWASTAPTSLLLGLCAVLRTQVAGLRATSA
jgi:octaprenyl-diphosphate synthase